jgi:hypothetical protein
MKNEGKRSILTSKWSFERGPMKEETTEGIVLRSSDYKERQRIITVLTLDAGVMSLIVKNISKNNAHLIALTTPFCRSEFVYKKGNSELMSLLEGTPLDEHGGLRQSYAHISAAGEIIQAILLSQLPGKPAPALYQLLQVYLKQLSSFPNPENLLCSFYLKVLKHEGMIAASEPDPTFSTVEWSQVAQLLEARAFLQLKQTPILPGLKAKIHHYFKENLRV